MTLIVRKVWQVVCLDSGGWCYLAELGQKPEQRRTHPDNRSGDSEHPSSTPHNVWWLSFIDNLQHLVILSALDCKNCGRGWGYLQCNQILNVVTIVNWIVSTVLSQERWDSGTPQPSDNRRGRTQLQSALLLRNVITWFQNLKYFPKLCVPRGKHY